jgi:hypothetical protein
VLKDSAHLMEEDARHANEQRRWWTTRAVTVGAPPAEVWPWLVQMGPGRAGA